MGVEIPAEYGGSGILVRYIFLEHKITFTLEASFLSAILVVEELAKVFPCVL